jgi:hypothetical protein
MLSASTTLTPRAETRPSTPTTPSIAAIAWRRRTRTRIWSPMAVRSSASGWTDSTGAPARPSADSIFRITTFALWRILRSSPPHEAHLAGRVQGAREGLVGDVGDA